MPIIAKIAELDIESVVVEPAESLLKFWDWFSLILIIIGICLLIELIKDNYF